MNQTRTRNIAVFIGVWDFILCFILFQVLNIWGIFYPLLCVFKELKSYYSNQLLKFILLLRFSIVLLALISLVIVLPRLLLRILEAYPYFHIVYASLAIVIDFVWIRPNISQYYDRIHYFPIIKNNEYK